MDVVIAGDVAERFASVASTNRFAALVRGQFEGAAQALPRALARSRPSLVRARISSRSNSAKPPSTVKIRRPWRVVVSAHVSPSERKPGRLAVIAASVLRRSRVERASRSSRVTISTSPSASWSSNRRARRGRIGPARHFAKDVFGPGGGQLPHLRVDALAVRRYPRIAVDHGLIDAINLLHEKSPIGSTARRGLRKS